jgi:transposase
MRLARGAGHLGEPVPVGELVRVAGRGAGSGAPGTCAGSGAWGWTGSLRRCGASCPGGAGSGRARGIIRAVFAALADPAGVTAHRPGALERAHLALGDWRDTRARLAGTEARMCAVLEVLGLAGLVATISGLTVTGAAAILAGTGDPARFATARALDGHAGLCPRDNSSGAAQGKTSISGRGRPGLRLAAWRAVWAAMPDNPVMAARFAYLTTRQDNRLARQQARTACAAALLRWIHVVVTRHIAWDPAIAAGTRPALGTGS